MTWFMLLAVIHTGFMGRWLLDRQREWLSCLGAWVLICALGWVVLFSMVVYGPVLLFALEGWWLAGAASGWVLSTLGGLLASRGGGKAGPLRRLLIAVAPYVFVVGLLVLVAVGMDWGLSRFNDTDPWAHFRGEAHQIHEQEKARRIAEAAQEAAENMSWGVLRAGWSGSTRLI